MEEILQQQQKQHPKIVSGTLAIAHLSSHPQNQLTTQASSPIQSPALLDKEFDKFGQSSKQVLFDLSGVLRGMDNVEDISELVEGWRASSIKFLRKPEMINKISTLMVEKQRTTTTALSNIHGIAGNPKSPVLVWIQAVYEISKSLFEEIMQKSKDGTLTQTLADEKLRAGIDKKCSSLSNLFDSFELVYGKVQNNKLVGNSNEDILLVNAQAMIDDSEGFEFWKSSFGIDCYSVPWQKFKEAMNARQKLSSTNLVMLEQNLDAEKSGFITALNWGLFLHTFGPGIAKAIALMSESVEEDFFAGFIDFEEAQEILRGCLPGAYLVRFSGSSPCGYAIAFRDAAPGSVTQLIIQARTYSGGFELEGKIYASLKDLIKDNSEVLRFPAPTIHSISRQKYFKGFITYDETTELLQGTQPGTFLFRFSRGQSGSLVLGYVDAAGKVKQSRISSEPEKGGYMLGNTIYSSLEDIVQRNRDKLKFPHISQEQINAHSSNDKNGSEKINQATSFSAVTQNQIGLVGAKATSASASAAIANDPYGSIPSNISFNAASDSMDKNPYGQIPSIL